MRRIPLVARLAFLAPLAALAVVGLLVAAHVNGLARGAGELARRSSPLPYQRPGSATPESVAMLEASARAAAPALPSRGFPGWADPEGPLVRFSSGPACGGCGASMRLPAVFPHEFEALYGHAPDSGPGPRPTVRPPDGYEAVLSCCGDVTGDGARETVILFECWWRDVEAGEREYKAAHRIGLARDGRLLAVSEPLFEERELRNPPPDFPFQIAYGSWYCALLAVADLDGDRRAEILCRGAMLGINWCGSGLAVLRVRRGASGALRIESAGWLRAKEPVCARDLDRDGVVEFLAQERVYPPGCGPTGQTAVWQWRGHQFRDVSARYPRHAGVEWRGLLRGPATASAAGLREHPDMCGFIADRYALDGDAASAHAWRSAARWLAGHESQSADSTGADGPVPDLEALLRRLPWRQDQPSESEE